MERWSGSRLLARRIPLWQRIVALAVLTPALFVGAAGGSYYIRLHLFCAAMSLDHLPVAPRPSAGRRLLVISPHCDDETLGVGGQIADARRANLPVTVAFLTNGDGFRIAASRSLRKVNVGPADFVRFAELRQTESLAALSELGVPADSVDFLGYPDRGLKPMWETNWGADNPFQSGFTDVNRSPYPRTFTTGAPYTGQSLVADLTRLMETTRPTDILVTHPADDHPDHSAAAAFTEAALHACRGRGEAWAVAARLHYYIVHRGDWPLPQGSHPEKALLPPPGLVTSDTRWNVYALSPAARAAKARALSRYSSQLGISGRFLSSFLRTNELYADLPTPLAVASVTVRTGINTVDGTSDEGDIGACETAAANLAGDNLARYVEPSGDVTDIRVRETDTLLRVRLRTRAEASPHIRYSIVVRGYESAPTGVPRSSIRTVNVPVPARGNGQDGHFIEAIVPLSSLGFDRVSSDRCVWVSAETRWLNRLPVIDRTGYREFDIDAPRRVPIARQQGVPHVIARNRVPVRHVG